MTRSEVARRLGKSIAAVRRLEGVYLHPTRDARGVHRFDADEVEALAEGIRRGEVSLWRELHAETGAGSTAELNCQRCKDLQAEVCDLHQQLERQRRQLNREVQALQSQREQEQALVAIERQNLDRELNKLIAALKAG